MLGNSNLPGDAKKDLNRVEDFLKTVTEAHIVCALCQILGIPSREADIEVAHDEDLDAWLHQKLDLFVSTFLDLAFQAPPCEPAATASATASATAAKKKKGKKTASAPPKKDLVFQNAKLLLNVGLFLLILKKTTRRGDGDMTVPMWKSLTGYYHMSHQTKYR